MANERLYESLGKLDIDREALAERTALVTGAARGIGEQLARALAHLDVRVLLVDVLASGERVARELVERGARAEFSQVDLTDLGAVDELIDSAQHTYGPIDILVNNASKLVPDSMSATPIETWDYVYQAVNRASARLTSGLLPGMLERRHGVVANTIAAEGLSFAAPFSAMMVAQRSTVLSLAGELGTESHVKVFGFAPGLTRTRLALDYIAGAARAQGITPEEWIRRFAHNPGYEGLMPPEDCAAAYAYCLSHARDLHGQIADAFQPLVQCGIIEPKTRADAMPDEGEGKTTSTVNQIGEYVRGIASVNRNLELRIAERTRELQAATEQLANQKRAIEQISATLSRYLPEQIYESIFRGEIAPEVTSRRKYLTVFFSDICDFASKAERLEPEALSEVVNTYFSAMTEVARDCGATVDKFIGDALLVFFGDPESQGPERDAEGCLEMAVRMQRRVDELQDHFTRLGLHEPLAVRMGVNSGFCTVGNFGSFARMEYTIFGRPVNVAARLQQSCPPGSILVSRNTRALVADRFRFLPGETLSLKGVSEGIEACELKFDLQAEAADGNAGNDALALRKRLEEIDLARLGEAEKKELLGALDRLMKG